MFSYPVLGVGWDLLSDLAPKGPLRDLLPKISLC